MRTALDTNILSSILAGDRNAQAISNRLEDCGKEGILLISPVVYAEIYAFPRMNEIFLAKFLSIARIKTEYPIDKSVWTIAGQRFAQYATRRRASMDTGPKRLLADFIIGAHALHYADRLMTSDAARFRQDFPDLHLHPPTSE